MTRLGNMPVTGKSLVVLSDNLPLGGTATFVMNLCRGMACRNDWNCTAAALRGLDVIGEQIRAAGLPLLAPRASDLLHEDRIEELHRQCGFRNARAVVAGLGSGSFDFLRYVPADCLRIGMIQSDDGCVYELVERYLPWIDIVAGVSNEICGKMESRLGSRRIPVVHQPYGVPMPDCPPTRKLNGPLRVLYLGRIIEEQKRVGLMTRVIRHTLAETPDIHWTIAGDGPDLAAMKADFSADAARVNFLGRVSYQDVPDILRNQDAYFLCSDYEGLPLSLLEAMGAGLVPVVSDLPSGVSEVVNDENGIRVAIDDENGYAEALIRLAGDPALRHAMSTRAAAEVRDSHSIRAMADRWATMLDAHLSVRVPEWPSSCRATAPMELGDHWFFRSSLRPIRRITKQIRQTLCKACSSNDR